MQNNTIIYQNQEWELSNNHLAFINVHDTKVLSDFQFIGDFEIIFADQTKPLTETANYTLVKYQNVLERNSKACIIFWFKSDIEKFSFTQAELERNKIHEYACNSHIDFEFLENELTVNSKFHPFYSQKI